MNIKKSFWLAVLVFCNMSCMENMNNYPFRVTKAITQSNLPSGSGLAVVESAIYIVGDDSPWLFKYSKDFEPLNKYLLLEGFPLEGRIPKAVKPDFESMAEVQEGGNTSLLIFGSGSISPERDMLIKVDTQQMENPQVFSLTTFYDHLLFLMGGSRADLNIEGALVIKEELFLFNRADNQIFVVNWKNLLKSLQDEKAIRSLDIRQFKIDLPDREGVIAGFSGACFVPEQNKILFTATLEATEDWIADGEILGSYLGVLDLNKLSEGKAEKLFLVLGEDGQPIKDKLESLAIHNLREDGALRLVAVADNDDGTSRLLELEVDASFLKREI